MKKMSCFMFTVLAVFAAQADTRTWVGGGLDDNWQTAGNWDGGVSAPVADDVLVFTGGSPTTAQNDFPAGTAFSGITLNNTANFTLSGNGITLTGPLVAQATGVTDTMSLPIELGGSFAFGLEHPLIISGVISGAYGLTKNGGANVTLNGLNTYTGQTALNGGGRVYFNTLKNLGEPCSFGAPVTPEAGTIRLSCMVDYSGSDAAVSDRNLHFNNDLQLHVNGTGSITLNGGIGGPGAPLIRGARDLFVNGPVTNTSGFGRTDTGTVFLYNPNNTFPGWLNISDGTIAAVSLANSGTVCAIGTGPTIVFGQTGWETTGRLRYIGSTDAACNRSLLIYSSQFSHGGVIENATANTTITFSGPMTMSAGTKPRVDTAAPLWLDGVGSGVMLSPLPAGLRVIKQGAGTWQLMGENVHTGATSVTSGRLLVDGSIPAASTLNVGSNGTLGGTGVVHGVVNVSPNGIIAPGSIGTTGTLTLASATLNTSRMVFDLQDPVDGPSSALHVTGAMMSNGRSTITLNLPAGGLPPGTYTLASCGTCAGTFALDQDYPGLFLHHSATSLFITVVPTAPVPDLTWEGAVSSVWDDTTANWSPTLYADGLNVLFDDTGAAGSPITIPSPVAPNTVTIDTTSNTYTLDATGTTGLSGDAWVFKDGTASFTLDGTHIHSGSTLVRDGTLNLLGNITASPLVISKNAILDQSADSVISGANVSLTLQGKANLRGANTYGGETTIGLLGEIDRDTTIYHDHALGATSGGVTVIGGNGSYHNRLILTQGITVTGKSLTLFANGRSSLSYSTTSGSATWDGDIITAPTSIAFIHCTHAGGTLFLGTPGTEAIITGHADLSFRDSGLIVCNNRIRLPNNAIVRDNNGTLQINSTNNVMGALTIAEGTVWLGADNALPVTVNITMGKPDANAGNKAYLNLNGHTQTIATFTERHYDPFTDGNIGCQCITSAPPATIIFDGPANNALLKRNSDFRGAVTVVQAGSGSLEIGQVNYTSGAFVVSNGVMRFNATGSVGAECTSVIVAGGQLELQNNNALSPIVKLEIPEDSDGVIDILDGVNVTVAELWFGEMQKRAGTWGATGSGARYVDNTRFTGLGTLTVLHDKSGTLIMVR